MIWKTAIFDENVGDIMVKRQENTIFCDNAMPIQQISVLEWMIQNHSNVKHGMFSLEKDVRKNQRQHQIR